ncbi:MAG: glycosyltransferase [Fibrobacterota bacterium]|nr:glycosyltransferase [Fibrobacterota bacterium]
MRINQYPVKQVPVEASGGLPKVTIGMPLYNGEKYLQNALECIRNQDFLDYEVIISDNASTDSTAEICRQFAAKNPKVSFHLNIGAVPNFNFVFTKARGTYFIWLSYDDGWAPDYLRKCVSILDRNPSVVLCFSEVDFMDADGQSHEHEEFYGVGYNRLDASGKPLLERIRILIAETNWYAIYGMYRSDVLRKTRLGRPVFGWDVHLTLEILLLGEIYIIPKKLMRYRIIPKTSNQQLKAITNSDEAEAKAPYTEMARGLFEFLMEYDFGKDLKAEIRNVFVHNFLEGNLIWRNEIFNENREKLIPLPPEQWISFLIELFPMPRQLAPLQPRILWQNRNDSDRLPGGDTTVLKEIVKNLLGEGAKVDVSLEDTPDLASYTLVQLTNISRTRDTLEHVRNAKRGNLPTVLIPLYEDMDRYLVPATKMDLLYQQMATTKTALSLDEIRSTLSRFDLPEHPLDNHIARFLGIGDKANQKEILSGVDCVLTSGDKESRSITDHFGPMRRMETFHFGFNRDFLGSDGSAFSGKYGLKDFVMCVGRLESRKNQWSLIEIFRTLPKIKLVLIGTFSHPGMENAVKAFAPPNVVFLDRLPFAELVSAFGAARVHVLASWYELPGLVSLEAAAAGCRIVSTSWGTASDYFQDRIHYCEPDEPVGIRNAILQAYDSNPNPDLRSFVEESYGWDKSARRLREIYRRILAERP